ncbi:MAG: MFS transporter [Chloroflexota bacterium]
MNVTQLRKLSRHPVILAVYLPSILIGTGLGVLIPILPLYISSFEVSYGLVGLVIASRSLGMLLGDVPAGIILSRISTRGTMVLGIAVTAITLLAMGLAQTVVELLIYGLINGLGQALWNISRMTYMATTIDVAQRGRAIAIFGGIHRVGAFVGPLIGGLLAEAFGLRVPILFTAVLAIVTIVFPLLYVTQEQMLPEYQAAHKAKRKTKNAGIAHHLHEIGTIFAEYRQIFMTAGLAQLLAQSIRQGRNVIIPLYGADVLGLNVLQVSTIISVAAAIDMSLFYPTGEIMDRIGRKFAIVPGFCIQALGLALVPFSAMYPGIDGYYGLLFATMMIGLGNGLTSGTMMTLGSDLSPKEATSEFIGVWRLIGDTGMTASPVVVGTIAGAAGLGPAALVIAAIGFIATSIFVMFVPETLKKMAVVGKSVGR